MKGFVKKLLSCTLAAAMICTLAPKIGGTAGKVEAAESGTWQFVKEKETLPESYDGYVPSFEGIVSGNAVLKTHWWTPNPWGGSDYYEERDQYYECSVPPKSITAGKEVTLTLRTYTKNLNLGAKQVGYSAGQCMAEITEPNATSLSSVADYGYFYVKGTTDTKYVGKTWSDNNTPMDISGTVVAKMPKAEDFKEGDRVSIYFSNYDAGIGMAFYEWQYEFKESGSSSSTNEDEDATTIGEDSDDEDDLVVGQVKNVKLTNKKVKRIYISFDKLSDATGYEIRYSTNKSFSGAKKLTTTSNKGYFKNSKGKKATFKKGKTYYVQVRAFAKDSDGSKVYGSWSAKKKVKIKK